MPSNITRVIDEHYVAQEKIPASAFIPRFLSEKAKDVVKGDAQVGVRGFNCPQYKTFSPYLTLSDITVNPPLMFPDHPHCGHEMMMYVIDGNFLREGHPFTRDVVVGEFTHEDFMGWKETFGREDVHWMTTGKGIIHAQIPGNHPKNRHVQFWINLPKDKKGCEPGNQVLRASKTPLIKGSGSTVRLLVGEYGGQRSTIKTATPLLMMDVHITPNSNITIDLKGTFFVGAYTLTGTGTMANQKVQPYSVIASKPTGNQESTLSCQAGPDGLRFLLYAGEPINDPISVDGYFVCRTKEETAKAVQDFDQRENSFAKGKSWSSKIAN